jgi:hypothetical protein
MERTASHESSLGYSLCLFIMHVGLQVLWTMNLANAGECVKTLCNAVQSAHYNWQNFDLCYLNKNIIYQKLLYIIIAVDF